MADKIEVYRDSSRKWRWRRRSEGNNAVISTSGESFDSKRNAAFAAGRANPDGHDEVTFLDEATE